MLTVAVIVIAVVCLPWAFAVVWEIAGALLGALLWAVTLPLRLLKWPLVDGWKELEHNRYAQCRERDERGNVRVFSWNGWGPEITKPRSGRQV